MTKTVAWRDAVWDEETGELLGEVDLSQAATAEIAALALRHAKRQKSRWEQLVEVRQMALDRYWLAVGKLRVKTNDLDFTLSRIQSKRKVRDIDKLREELKDMEITRGDLMELLLSAKDFDTSLLHSPHLRNLIEKHTKEALSARYYRVDDVAEDAP